MLAAIGVGSIDELFADIPPAKRLTALARSADAQERARGRAASCARLAEKNHAAGDGPFFVGAGAYRHHVPATRRPPHPALGVPDLLHALPAGDRAGHAAISLRVPDAGREPDRHGGRQRLHVRRLDRHRRGGADGAPRHAAAEGGALRRAAPALSRDGRDGVAHGRRRARRARRPIRAARRTSSPRSTTRPPASSCSRRPSTASSSTSRRSPRRRTRTARCSSPSSPRSSRSGSSSRPARRAPTSSSARARSIGNALNFGGPYVGLFATRQKYIRQMPGRLCGMTVDAEGKRGFVLTLSTREQHIRRDKATSNICTNSGLCCLAFTAHMTLLGETGPAAARGGEPRARLPARRRAREGAGRRGAERERSSTSSPCACRSRPRQVVEALARARASWPACRSRGSSRAAGARRPARRRRDRDGDRRDIAAFAQALEEAL